MSTNAILSIVLLLLGFSAAAGWFYEKHRLRKQALTYLRTEYLSRIHLGKPFPLDELEISKMVAFTVDNVLMKTDGFCSVYLDPALQRKPHGIEAAACIMLAQAFSVVVNGNSQIIQNSDKVLFFFFSYYQTVRSIIQNANGLTDKEREDFPRIIEWSFTESALRRASTLSMADFIGTDPYF